MILLLFVLVSWSSASSLSTTPSATPPSKHSIEWPKEFEMDFITPLGPFQSFGKLAYSLKLNSTRIDHSAGAFECQKFYNTTSPCVLYFTTTGLWRYLVDDGSCCLDLPNIHSTGTDWMKDAVFNGTANVSGRLCYRWLNVHTYYTNVLGDPRIPCEFTFGPAPEQDMFFLFHSFREHHIDPAQFKLPSNCKSKCQ